MPSLQSAIFLIIGTVSVRKTVKTAPQAADIHQAIWISATQTIDK